jgi:hypothetical protein
VTLLDDLDIVGYDWPEFLHWFAHHWEPGDHVGIVAPTKAGKTTCAVGICSLRKHLLAFDPKGGDSTLAGSKWPRVSTFPLPREWRKAVEEGKGARLIIGNVIRDEDSRARSRALQRQYLTQAFNDGGWTIYVDELQLMADRRFGGMADSVEELLISARDSGISVVTSFQRPANVPRAATDQAIWFIVGYTRDTDVVGRLGEMAGRSRAEMRGMVRGMKATPNSFLVFSSNPREPIVAIVPDKVVRKRVR